MLYTCAHIATVGVKVLILLLNLAPLVNRSDVSLQESVLRELLRTLFFCNFLGLFRPLL